MKIRYVLANPTENRTVLVTCAVADVQKQEVAARLMRLEPTAEQLGFVDLDAPALQMAGGEFCGNASMSAAALYAREKRRLVSGQTEKVVLSASGAPHPISATVAREGEAYICSVEMPRPLSISAVTLPLEGGGVRLPAVRFAGITHLICENEIDRETAEAQIRLWCRELGADALGIMFLSEEMRRLTPLVYVPGAGTLFWESSCAGGTTAYGAWQYARTGKPFSGTLTEPGGSLSVFADKERLTLSGKVVFEKEAEIEIGP